MAREDVVVDTVRRFKGLERPAIILITSGDEMDRRELAYVAFSLARAYLCIVSSRGGANVSLRGCTVIGGVRLLSAEIGSELSCIGASLCNDGCNALYADRMSAGGNVSLRGATVTGAVRLLGARIGTNLSLVGATLSNKGRYAINADRISTEQSVFLRNACVTGGVRLIGARIGGDLSCTGAKLDNGGGTSLSAVGARIEGKFFLRDDEDSQHSTIDGKLNLTAAEIGHINDHPLSWPKVPGSLLLDRCIYGALTGHGVSAPERIAWLALQDPTPSGKEFWPQP